LPAVENNDPSFLLCRNLKGGVLLGHVSFILVIMLRNRGFVLSDVYVEAINKS